MRRAGRNRPIEVRRRRWPRLAGSSPPVTLRSCHGSAIGVMTDSVGTEKCWSNPVTARGPRSERRAAPAAPSVSTWMSLPFGDGDDHAGQLVDREGGDARPPFPAPRSPGRRARSGRRRSCSTRSARHVRSADGVQGELHGDERPLPVHHEVGDAGGSRSALRPVRHRLPSPGGSTRPSAPSCGRGARGTGRPCWRSWSRRLPWSARPARRCRVWRSRRTPARRTGPGRHRATP